MARLLDEFAGFNVLPANLTIDRYTNCLERFDNQGLVDGPTINSTEVFTGFKRVTGRSSKTIDNTVPWYIQDLDTITVTNIADPLITLYFTPVANVLVPYPVGCTVRIENRNNLYSADVEVLECTQDSITFANPGNFPSTSNLFIEILENPDSSTVFPVTINYSSIYVSQGSQGQISLNSGTPAVPAVGQQEFTGSSFPFNFFTTWTVPAGVTSISAVAIGGGGGGRVTTNGGTGGNGGDLRYVNNIAVTPGEILTIQVGVAGYPLDTSSTNPGGDSSISRPGTTLVSASGGRPGVINGQSPGSNTGTNIGTGGTGGSGGFPTTTTTTSGGGGAGGYSGNGGNGGVNAAGSNGTGGGGGGGGGAGSGVSANRGGGVGLLGEGSNGVGGAFGQPGLPGSNGVGELYGAGGGGSDSSTIVVGANYGGQGGVRIMWGPGRSYPSTLTANQPTVTFVPEILPFISITERTVDFFNNIRFYDGMFVKLSTASGYSTTVQIYNTANGSLTFDRPVSFPVEETQFTIENASPSVLSQNIAKTNFLSTKKPYTFTRPMDYLVSSEVSPNPFGIRRYSLTTEIQGHIDNRRISGQLLPSSNIKGVEPQRRAETVFNFTVKSNTIAAIDSQSLGMSIWNPQFAIPSENRQVQKVDDYDPANFYFTLFIGGVYQLTGVTLLADPSGNNLAATELVANQFRLESYDNIGVYENLNITAISQNNILYGTIENYIDDSDIFSYSLASPPITQTLFFRYNEEQPQLIAYPGHYIVLTDLVSQYSTTVQIAAATTNTISFTRPLDFPNNYENQWSLQTATLFYYPKEKVFDDLIATVLPFTGIFEPKQNLFISEYRPIQKERSVNFFIDREFQDTLPLIKDTQFKLETFPTENRLPSDFKVAVVGENTEIVYDVTNWFINDDDQLEYSVVPITNKILYFSQTETLLFKVGDSVRIYNINNNFDVIETVLAATATSITIATQITDTIGTSGTFIEVVTTSVYPQAFVSTRFPPLSPRENLYYFNNIPGYRYNLSQQQGFLFEKSTETEIGKITNLDVLKGDLATLAYSDGDFLPILVPDRSFLDSATLARDSITVRGDRTQLPISILNDYINQFTLSTKISPQNPRDLFYYFRIAPGYKYNSSIQQGNTFEQFDNGLDRQSYLNRDLFRLKAETAVLTADSIKPRIPLRTDRSTISESAVQPLLNKDIFKLKSDSNVLSSDLITKFSIDQEDVAIFTIPVSGELSSAITAKLPILENSLGKLAASISVKQSVLDYINGNVDNTFLQSQLALTTAPTTPREALYYFNMAPGYRSNNTITQGIALDSNYIEPADTLLYPEKVTFPSAASEVFFTVSISNLTSSIVVKADTIEENLGFTEIFKAPTVANEIFTLPTVGKLNAATVVRAYVHTINYETIDNFTNSLSVRFTGEPTSAAELLFMSLIAPGRKAGALNTAFGSALDLLPITLDTDDIVRLKTGEFKRGSVGIGDGAAVRKEPIQFWN